ncbi:MAG: tetratricopeptide repeat protein [Myxococcota bacterium]
MRRLLTAALALALQACVTTQGASTKLTPREEAQVLLARGDGAKALPILLELQAKAPDDLGLARQVAEAHVKAGSADAFLAALAPKDTALSHYQQGLVRFARSADASGPAIADFRRAAELAPEEPEFRYRLGVALLESEQYEAARAELEAAAKRAGDRTAWFLPLAKARYRTGDEKGATEALRVVVTGSPSAGEVKTARALMEQIADPFSGFPRSARPALEEAIQWQVADVPQEAITRLEELLRDHPDQAIVHAMLGLAWARLDDAGRAVEELKRAIELAPNDGKNHLYLAQLYEARQRPKNAEEHFLKAVERNPLLDQAWLKLGDVALERQDLAGARQAFQIAAHLLPGDPAAHGKLALVHQLEGNWPAADRELHLVLDAEPENVEFLLRLGLLHTERFTKAKNAVERESAAAEASKWLQKVLDAQPENALASRALARVKAR